MSVNTHVQSVAETAAAFSSTVAGVKMCPAPCLQVLVSIQGLVLVPEPYYNEAGYGRQVRVITAVAALLPLSEGREPCFRAAVSLAQAIYCNTLPCPSHDLCPNYPMVQREPCCCSKHLLLRYTRPCENRDQTLNLQVGSAGGARNSAVYNENAFLLSARSMVHCTRQPPPDFRPLMQVGHPAARPQLWPQLAWLLKPCVPAHAQTVGVARVL